MNTCSCNILQWMKILHTTQLGDQEPTKTTLIPKMMKVSPMPICHSTDFILKLNKKNINLVKCL